MNDNLDVLDVESSILTGSIEQRLTHDPRGTRYVVMYDFPCEHCEGTVVERQVDQEALRHKGSFVILENVPIGVCDHCGARYYDASVLRQAAEIGRGKAPAVRTVQVPVDEYSPV